METTARKHEFKKGVSAEDGRRRRGETSVQLRKSHKEENLSKRRNLLVNNFLGDETPSNLPTGKPIDGKYTVADIPSLVIGLRSGELSTQISSVRAFRRLLSTEHNPPIQQSIDCGAVPYFVSYLQRSECPELQFEAAWALTNIASTDRTRLVVDCGAVPHLVQQMSSPNAELREQCAW